MTLATCQSWHMIHRSMWHLQTHVSVMGASFGLYLQWIWNKKKSHSIMKRNSST